MDISQFCNICSSMENVANICNEEKTIIKNILLSFVDQSDDIDENNIYICLNCCKKLQDIYEFKEICVKNLIHYQNLYKRKLQLIQSEIRVKNESDEDFAEGKDTVAALNLFFKEEILKSRSSNSYDSEENDINSFGKPTRSDNVGSKLHTEFDLEISRDHLLVLEVDSNTYVENIKQDSPAVTADEDIKNTYKTKKTYQCKICFKFYSLSNIKKHEFLHTGEKPYKCNLCEKSFARPGNLKIHLRFHTGEKPHMCKVCNKMFATTSGLKDHERVHTGERPYKCEICNRAFSQSSSLKMHQFVHSGERIHKCTVCEKSFTTLGNLKQHKLIHNTQEVHTCNICGKAFSLWRNLRRHLPLHNRSKL